MAKYFRLNPYLEITAFLTAIAFHLWLLFHTTFVDWPEMLVYPWFLSKGMLYYRDVVLAYVPGSYYLLHGLYSLLGYSPGSERAIAYGFILLTDWLVYVVSRKVTKSGLMGIIALFFFVLWQPIFSGNTIWYETILAPLYLLTYLLLLGYIERPRLSRVLLVGAILGIATLIKQTAIWPLAFICLFIWLTGKEKRSSFFHAVAIGAVTVVMQGISWGYFALQGAGVEYGFWVFGFLGFLSGQSSMYALAPPRSDLTLIAPALIPFAALILSPMKKERLLLIVFTVAVLLAGLPRWGLHRLQPMLAFIAVGLSFLGAVDYHKKNTRIVLLVFAICLTILGSWRSFRVFVTLRDPMQPTFFTAKYESLVSYLDDHAPGSLYVLGNYDYVYFGRNETPVVLPWVPLFPWNGKVPGMEDRLIRSLEAAKPEYILYAPFHPPNKYYDGYAPEALFLYVSAKYEKIGAPPAEGGELLRRK
ncbi:MAG: ArnT family glycosyltransferase [Patescibacteria group bacterium]